MVFSFNLIVTLCETGYDRKLRVNSETRRMYTCPTVQNRRAIQRATRANCLRLNESPDFPCFSPNFPG